jgi:Ca2+:H+ antiporter
MRIYQFFRNDLLNVLLFALPLAIAADLLGWGYGWVFALSAIGVIPMARYIGIATEALAEHTGPRLGGLLNATLGNAAELIITIVAIRAGLLELVLASITGSILGNVLFVLGMSMLLGGIRNGIQSFNRRQASSNAILLVLAVMALVIPSLLSHYIGEMTNPKVEALSLGVATIMIVIYGLGILFSFKVHDGLFAGAPGVSHTKHPAAVVTDTEKNPPQNKLPKHDNSSHTSWSIRTALIVLALSTASVAYLSELLVGAVEPVVLELGISEFFLGIIVIPIIGNVAEHLVAVKVAIQNDMDLSVEIAIASSLQIALFVAPFLVFISLIMGNPLQLVFNQFELLALVIGAMITALVSQDGESNWLEGAELLAVYLILGLAFFLLP